MAELKARVMAAAAAERSPTRAAIRRRNALLGVLAVVTGLGAFVIFALLASDRELIRLGGDVASHRHLERSVWLVSATVGGALGGASIAVWVALTRGRSMLGRSRLSLLCACALIPMALLTWKAGISVAFGDHMVSWPERPGLRCLSLSLLVAAGPLLAFVALRRSAPVQPALNGAAIGIAAGACAWISVDLWCPVAFVPHLLLGHVLPLFLLAGMGALLGRTSLSLRSR